MALTYHLKFALIAFKLLAACIAALGIKPIQNQPASLKSVHLYSFITSQVHDTTITHLEPFLSQRMSTHLSTLARLGHDIPNTLSHTAEVNAFGRW